MHSQKFFHKEESAFHKPEFLVEGQSCCCLYLVLLSIEGDRSQPVYQLKNTLQVPQGYLWLARTEA
jgi:hypothetical protein